jgi:hypothetical protein
MQMRFGLSLVNRKERMIIFRATGLVLVSGIVSVLIMPSPANARTWACRKFGVGCPAVLETPKHYPPPGPGFTFTRSQSLSLPDTGAQNDDWSCGPNSGARVLRYAGYNASYGDLKRTVKRLGTFPGSNRLGTAPHELRNAMNQWTGGSAKLQRRASFDRLRSIVSGGRPVIALVRVGSIQGNRLGGIGIGGTWPSMHWFVVDGYDEGRRMIYFTDTNSQRGEMSYDDFQSMWGWSVGSGLASATFQGNGLETRTMIWVE